MSVCFLRFRQANRISFALNCTDICGLFLHITINGMIFDKIYWIWNVFWFYVKILSKTFLFPTRNQRGLIVNVDVKVKGSRNRAGVTQRVPGGLGSQIFMTFGTYRWWGRHPHAPAAFTPQECSSYSLSLGAESTSGPWCGRKEICHWKIQWHQRESIPGPFD
jgi:hypothetical protein